MDPVCSTLTVLDIVPFGQTGPSPQFYALRLSPPDWVEWHPGQFVMLRPLSFGMGRPLARPFSICHVTRTQLVCFFKIAGQGTQIISQLKAGDKILSWGPLGTWFSMDTDRPVLLLAGGMGIAPFVGYVHRHPKPRNISMLFGHKEDVGCYPVDSISEHIAVHSMQEKHADDLNRFIEEIEIKIRNNTEQGGLNLACGPVPFLKTVQRIARKYDAPLQISVETRMACGLGACLGCVCKTTDLWPESDKKNWPVQTCLKGPVFWAQYIEL